MENVLADLINRIILWVPLLLVAALIFLIFWVTARVIRRIIDGAGNIRHLNKDVLNLFKDAASTLLLVVGLITAFGTMGIDVAGMVAGLGLTGFALGFAFRDVLSNFLAGVLILLYEPFKRGDNISVTDKKGIVEEINLRYTILKGDTEDYLVPNGTLINNIITRVKIDKAPEQKSNDQPSAPIQPPAKEPAPDPIQPVQPPEQKEQSE
jgi:small conductance mechanosensitive channel